jgi:putative ABC transport system substrate-binding protein
LKRRDFIALAGGVAWWPLPARAQPALPVIGFLYSGTPETSEDRVALFRAGLGEMGFTEGRNVSIQFSWAFNQHDRLPALAAELVRRRVNVIFAGGGTPSAVAAKNATTTIPVVFQMAADPAETDLVTSLNRPGGNVTGVAAFSRELVGKRVELIRELIPGIKAVAFLNDPSSPVAENRRNDFEAAARTLALRSLVLKASSEREIGDAFETLARDGVRAIVLQGAPRFATNHKLIIALATRHRIAAIYEHPEIARAGGLISYGSSSVEATGRAGVYVGRILKGEKPADLPILLPTKFELVINMKAAKAIGLDIPPLILARADDVIE